MAAMTVTLGAEASVAETASVPMGQAQAASQVAPPALIRRIEITGSSLPPAVLARLRARYVGRTLDQATGERAAKALQAAYRRADVELAQVGGPALDAGGTLRLAVLEGRIEGVDVEGGRPRLRRTARAYAVRLMREAPLRRSSFQRATALIALLPGVRANSTFVVTERPGVMRLKVVLEAIPWRVDAQVTNRGALSFGEWQARADLRAFSVLKAGDQAVLTLGATPDAHQLRLIGGTYVAPIGRDGLTFVASATHVEADPYRSGQATRGTSLLAALAYPLVLRWDRTVTLTAVADGQDGQNAAGALVLSDERTRNLRLGLQGVRLYGTRTYTGGAVLTAGVPALGARPAYPGYAPTSYAKIQAFGAMAAPYGPWTVRLRAAGQATDGRVPSTEQFTLGGDDHGRAFRAVSLQGDQGVAAAVEVARRLRLGDGVFSGSEAFAYVDGGVVDVEARPGVRGGLGRLASVGAGVRLAIGPQVGLELSADHALTYENPLGGPHGDWRLGVRLHAAFAPAADLARSAAIVNGVDALRAAQPFTN